jgi:2-methylcitrate dehydratase PrpD
MTNQNGLEEFVDFIAAVRLADVPKESKEIAVWNILDTIGSIIAGGQETEIVLLSRRFEAADAKGPSTAMVDGFPLMERTRAAFLNGTAGVALEIDPGHRYALGHPSIHVLPAILAMAERDHRSGGDLLLSYLLGYEASARLGMSCTFNEVFHPHGVFGTVGTALACAHLAGATKELMCQAMNIACSFVVTNAWVNAVQGATVRNACAGMAGHFGILSWEMAASGFTGLEDAVPLTFGQMAGSAFSYEKFLLDLGNPFEIDRFYTKMHGSCGLTHPAVDALEDLRSQTGLDPDQIDRVVVRTFHPAASWDAQEPGSPLAARFSFPYAGAVMLIRGECAPESFSYDAMQDPRIREMAHRITVEEDRALTGRLPLERCADVEITLRDGTILKASKTDHRGNFKDPHSESEMEKKFLRSVEPIIREGGARQVMENILDMERIEDVADLTREIREFRSAV